MAPSVWWTQIVNMALFARSSGVWRNLTLVFRTHVETEHSVFFRETPSAVNVLLEPWGVGEQVGQPTHLKLKGS